MLKPFWIKWTFIAWLDMLQHFSFPSHPHLCVGYQFDLCPISISSSFVDLSIAWHPVQSICIRASGHPCILHSAYFVAFIVSPVCISGVSHLHVRARRSVDSIFELTSKLFLFILCSCCCFMSLWNHCIPKGEFRSIDQFGITILI